MQVSANTTNTSNIASDILKIKKAFPKLQNKKNRNSSENYKQARQTQAQVKYDD